MEALALLCTLHADGPATLRRLRRAGCGSLEQLEAYEPDQLASLLEIAPAVARRLSKEARVLADRLAPVFEDREEGEERDAPLGAAPAGQLGATDSSRSTGTADLRAGKEGAGERGAGERGAGERGAAAGGNLDSHDRRILGAVLERWGAGPPSDDSPHVSAADPTGVASSPVTTPPAPEVQLVSEPGQSAGLAAGLAAGLVAGCVDGLDDATACRLTELGITDLDLLAERESLPLAQDLGVPFAQVRRLQFLARQAARLEVSEIPEIPEIREIREIPEVPVAIPIPDPAEVAPASLRPIAPPPEPVSEPITEIIPEPATVIELGPGKLDPDPLDPVDLSPVELDPVELDPANLGPGDSGPGDSGRGDLGPGDSGPGDSGRGDLGRGDLGRGDLGRCDLGRGDLETAGLDLVVEELGTEGGDAKAREPRRFWEPRPFLGALDEIADPVPLPDESQERAQRDVRTPRREGVTLDWKFEIPRPPRRPEPEQPQELESAESARVLEGQARPLHEDDDAAGPFA